MFAQLISLALVAAAPSPITDTARVVVFPLKAPVELDALARRTTDDMLLFLAKKAGVSALSEAELALLVEHAKDKNELMSCASDACLDELARATDADKLVSGHLGRFGDGYLVTLSVIDVEKKSVEHGESASADSAAELPAAVHAALERLLGLEGSSEGPQPRRVALGVKPTKLAVIDLAAHGTTPALADNVTQLLALELKKIEGISVISKDEIRTMLQYEAEKQIAQCKSDVACLIEIGGALGVEYLVSGAVGKLEDTFVINLKLMQIDRAEVVARVSESYRGPERNLSQAVRFAARSLVGVSTQGRGDLAVLSEVGSARSKIDGDQLIQLPQRVRRLPAGKHTLATLADGYHPHFQEFYVEPDVTTNVRPDLIAMPSSWYDEWWVWTIIGAAVVGAVGTTVVIATDSPENGSVDVLVRR